VRIPISRRRSGAADRVSGLRKVRRARAVQRLRTQGRRSCDGCAHDGCVHDVCVIAREPRGHSATACDCAKVTLLLHAAKTAGRQCRNGRRTRSHRAHAVTTTNDGADAFRVAREEPGGALPTHCEGLADGTFVA